MATKRRQELRLQFAHAAINMIGYETEKLSSFVQQGLLFPHS